MRCLATEEYATVARGIVAWVREVLADAEGGYGASQDADVGLDDDGDYFTWTREEAAAVLTEEELEVAAAYYDIGTAGEMHHNPGKNVLFVASTIPQIALQTGRSEQETELLLKAAQARLRLERSRRQAPFIDRTRYTNWNAMMASAMLRAKAVLGDEWAGGHAMLTLERIRRENSEADAVAHTPGGMTGLLDDQVQTAAAALDAYEMTGDSDWLEWSQGIMDRVWSDYWDSEGGGLFDTARGRASEEGLLPARAKPVQDTPTPSPNGVAGIVCMRLHELTGDSRWKTRSEELLRAFAGSARELGLYAATYLLAAGLASQSGHTPGRCRRSELIQRGSGHARSRARRLCSAACRSTARAGRGSQPAAAACPERNDRRRGKHHGGMPALATAAVNRLPILRHGRQHSRHCDLPPTREHGGACVQPKRGSLD